MNRILPFTLVLLVTLLIVNAIPHKLHKRATTFGPCAKGSQLDVTFSPDPLTSGTIATFTIVGTLTPPASNGSQLVISLLDQQQQHIGEPLQADLCTDINNI